VLIGDVWYNVPPKYIDHLDAAADTQERHPGCGRPAPQQQLSSVAVRVNAVHAGMVDAR